jgi:hypothetical protein
MSRTKNSTKKPARTGATAEPLVHTKLTVGDIDTINACRLRLLNAAVLLQMGLLHHDDEEISGDDPEAIISDALLDVVDRLREDVTLIGVTINQAGDRDEAGLLAARRAANNAEAARRTDGGR